MRSPYPPLRSAPSVTGRPHRNARHAPVVLQPEARQRHRPAILPQGQQPVAGRALALPARHQLVGRFEVRAQLLHQGEAGTHAGLVVDIADPVRFRQVAYRLRGGVHAVLPRTAGGGAKRKPAAMRFRALILATAALRWASSAGAKAALALA